MALACLAMALVPGLIVPTRQVAPQSHRAHRRFAAPPIATITASPLEATAVEQPESVVQLLTTSPELMPAVLGTTEKQSKGIWAALRQGLDPLVDPVAESPVGLQLNSRHVSTRTQRELRAACAPLRAGNVTAESRSDSAGTQKLLLELHDGLAVECVLIPMGRHTSVCVSSQVRGDDADLEQPAAPCSPLQPHAAPCPCPCPCGPTFRCLELRSRQTFLLHPHPHASRLQPHVRQVGCARACRFCSTGTMGLVRHLDAHEIVHQVL